MANRQTLAQPLPGGGRWHAGGEPDSTTRKQLGADGSLLGSAEGQPTGRAKAHVKPGANAALDCSSAPGNSRRAWLQDES